MADSTLQLGRGFSLLVGGARSGKSDLAVELGKAWDGDVTFAATAEALDDDMANRISRHQSDRPESWDLIEAPLLNAANIAEVTPEALLIVDCITLLVSNLMMADKTNQQIEDHVSILTHALVSRTAPTIVISNEVGLGVHPDTELGRRYRGVLGRANKRLASRAETALFVSAGRVTPLQQLHVAW